MCGIVNRMFGEDLKWRGQMTEILLSPEETNNMSQEKIERTERLIFHSTKADLPWGKQDFGWKVLFVVGVLSIITLLAGFVYVMIDLNQTALNRNLLITQGIRV